MKISLGTIEIPKELWERCKKHGYTRDDVRQVIVQNGEESLMSALDTMMFCKKCGCTGTEGTKYSHCEHDWEQI